MSYGVVFIGVLWVIIRFLTGDWLASSTAYLDAFMIGGLSGCLYFLRGKLKPIIQLDKPTDSALGANKKQVL
jgi:hypothetical protein